MNAVSRLVMVTAIVLPLWAILIMGEFNSKTNNITIGDTIIIHKILLSIRSVKNNNNEKPPNKKNVKWQDSVSKQPLPNINDMMSGSQKQNSSNKNIEAALLKILKNQEYMINAINDLQDRI